MISFLLVHRFANSYTSYAEIYFLDIFCNCLIFPFSEIITIILFKNRILLIQNIITNHAYTCQIKFSTKNIFVLIKHFFIVFDGRTPTVCVSDDHLRNHGFILEKNDRKLLPLYDVNPSIYGDSLSLNITNSDATLDFNLALETAEFYGISIDIAKKSISKMREIINEHWEKLARKYGLSRNAIEYMRPAFDRRLKE